MSRQFFVYIKGVKILSLQIGMIVQLYTSDDFNKIKINLAVYRKELRVAERMRINGRQVIARQRLQRSFNQGNTLEQASCN